MEIFRDDLERALIKTCFADIAGTLRLPTIEAKKRGDLTPEGRRRLSLAMKKRWAERKMRES